MGSKDSVDGEQVLIVEEATGSAHRVVQAGNASLGKLPKEKPIPAEEAAFIYYVSKAATARPLTQDSSHHDNHDPPLQRPRATRRNPPSDCPHQPFRCRHSLHPLHLHLPLVPLHAARIPLLDQGFLKGDLTYDVASAWAGRVFRLPDHLTRLEASCRKMRYNRLPLSRAELTRLTLEMLARSQIRDAYICYIVTRGLERISNVPSLGKKAEQLTSQIYVFITPYVWVMPPAMQQEGSGSAVVARTVRRTPPGAFDPTVKNLQWGDFTRGLMEAGDRDAVYPFLTDGDGNLTEGAGYNVCVIQGGVLYTPDRGVLEGVTRKTVLEVARRNGIETRVEVVPIERVYRAEEVFVCTTAGGVMPITELDGRPVGSGKVGELTKKIWDGYWEAHWDEELSFAVDYAGDVGGKPRL